MIMQITISPLCVLRLPQKGYFHYIIGKIYYILEKYEAAHQN